MKAADTTPDQDPECSGQVGHPHVRPLHQRRHLRRLPGPWSERPELGRRVWPGFIPGPVREPLEVLPLAAPRRGPVRALEWLWGCLWRTFQAGLTFWGDGELLM